MSKREPSLPKINVADGDLANVTCRAWQAIQRVNDPPELFRRGVLPLSPREMQPRLLQMTVRLAKSQPAITGNIHVLIEVRLDRLQLITCHLQPR